MRKVSGIAQLFFGPLISVFLSTATPFRRKLVEQEEVGRDLTIAAILFSTVSVCVWGGFRHVSSIRQPCLLEQIPSPSSSIVFVFQYCFTIVSRLVRKRTQFLSSKIRHHQVEEKQSHEGDFTTIIHKTRTQATSQRFWRTKNQSMGRAQYQYGQNSWKHRYYLRRLIEFYGQTITKSNIFSHVQVGRITRFSLHIF